MSALLDVIHGLVEDGGATRISIDLACEYPTTIVLTKDADHWHIVSTPTKEK